MSVPALSPHPVIILGMFRSGTSCVATCFKELGYYFGDEAEFFPADDFNPGGYQEIKDLMNLNRKILGTLGMQHFRIEEIPADWREIPGVMSQIDSIEAMLKSKLGGRIRWGWKEPQTSVLMPLYKQVFEANQVDPFYVICVRNPLAVCASQRTHSPLPHIGERVIGLWLHYTLSSLRETQGKRRLVIHYESFLQDPILFLSRASAFLETDAINETQLEAAAGKVRPEWQHNRPDEAELKGWPELVKDVYDLAKQCSQDPEGLLAGTYDQAVEAQWRRWRQMREMVKSSAIPTGRIISTWAELGRTRSREEGLVPTGSWQTVKVPIEAPPGSIVRLDPYQTPCLLWIRRAVLNGPAASVPADLRPGRSGMLGPVEGMRRLVIWGPEPMLLQLPTNNVYELEIEILIQSNANALAEVITVLKGNLEFVVQKFNQAKQK